MAKVAGKSLDAYLRDNLLGFIVAGHETSASALGWALYLLATHPEVQDRVAAEAQIEKAMAADPDDAAYLQALLDSARQHQQGLRAALAERP